MEYGRSVEMLRENIRSCSFHTNRQPFRSLWVKRDIPKYQKSLDRPLNVNLYIILAYAEYEVTRTDTIEGQGTLRAEFAEGRFHMNVGPLIRSHRKNKKLTLKIVAERVGVSEGFLSQVENNVNSPSVDTLVKICNAVGINAGDLLNQVENQERLVVIRKRDWDDMDVPHTGFTTRRFFSPENRTVIDSAVLVMNPNTSIPVRKGIKNGQELLCILRGSVELLHSEGTINLKEGDAVHYWSDKEKQRITNNSKDRTVVFWVGTL